MQNSVCSTPRTQADRSHRWREVGRAAPRAAVHDGTIRPCGRRQAGWDGWAGLLARVLIVLSISYRKYGTAEVDAWSCRAGVAAGVCT